MCSQFIESCASNSVYSQSITILILPLTNKKKRRKCGVINCQRKVVIICMTDYEPKHYEPNMKGGGICMVIRIIRKNLQKS